MVGLGHMRRNLLLAQTLVRSSVPVTALMLAEAREANAFPMPAGLDCLSLPAMRRNPSREIGARYLDVPPADLLRLRARTIRAALEAFEPDIFIVDHLPRGAGGELDETLPLLASRRQTRTVLGLRDVLEDPETVRREWWHPENIASIRAYYDAIWIYGDPFVYDPIRAYGFPPEVSAKVRFTGYMDYRARLKSTDASTRNTLARLKLPKARLVLCLLGGGQDGAALAEAFLRAELPTGSSGIVLAGPYMPASDRKRLERIAGSRSRVRVLDFLAEPTCLLPRADRVISMAGYNTTLEILSFEKRALLVPRANSRREQWIRAKRFEELGLVDVLAPDNATPKALTAWLAAPPTKRWRERRKLRLDGLERLPGLLNDLLHGANHETTRPRHDDIRCYTA